MANSHQCIAIAIKIKKKSPGKKAAHKMSDLWAATKREEASNPSKNMLDDLSFARGDEPFEIFG